MPDERLTWELLKPLGLEITPHSDPSVGWGYIWQGRDVGRPRDAEVLPDSLCKKGMQLASWMPLTRHVQF